MSNVDAKTAPTAEPQQKKEAPDTFKITVQARPETGIWTPAKIQFDQDVIAVQIGLAEDSPATWQYGEHGESCGAGGIRKRGADCLCAWAPLGALIGKFGGSDSDDTSLPDVSAAPAMATSPWITLRLHKLSVFAIGSVCEIEVPDGFHGPLYFTMNDHLSRFGFHSGSLNVVVRLLRKHGPGQI